VTTTPVERESPGSPDSPRSPDEQLVTPVAEQATLQELHRWLLATYAGIVNAGTFPGPSYRGFALFGTNPLRRTFVRWHIRHRLTLVGACYVRMIETLDQESDAEMRQWLRTAADGSHAFADSLPGGRRIGLAALLPLAIAGIFKIRGASWLTLAASLAAFTIGYACLFLLLAMILAFHGKRKLFLEAVLPEESGLPSVFHLEQALFERLGRRRPMERQVDVISVVATTTTVCLGVIAVATIYIEALGPLIWILTLLGTFVIDMAILRAVGVRATKRIPR